MYFCCCCFRHVSSSGGLDLRLLGNYTTRVGEGEHVYKEAAADDQLELREAPGPLSGTTQRGRPHTPLY